MCPCFVMQNYDHSTVKFKNSEIWSLSTISKSNEIEYTMLDSARET